MAFTRSATSYEIGEIVAGRYEITATVARGAFGCVYRAQHTTMRSDVAVKLLALDPAQVDDDIVRRFFREAQVTSFLRSQHTVRVFDVGQLDDGPLYMVMEFIDGPTLEEVLRHLARHSQALGSIATIDIAVAILSSLAEAHDQGLVHRDLKPANIAFANGPEGPVVKVLDFGIAHVEDSSLTAENKSLGTPAYMSPEQWRGERLDGRSDLYALGVILYRCLTAQLPFTGSALAMMHGHLEQAPADAADVGLVPVDPDLAVIVMRCLAKQAGDRVSDARALREQLRALRAELVRDGGENGELNTLALTAGLDGPNDASESSEPAAESGEAATGTLRAVIAEVDRARREAQGRRNASQQLNAGGAGASVAPASGAAVDSRPRDSSAALQGGVAQGKEPPQRAVLGGTVLLPALAGIATAVVVGAVMLDSGAQVGAPSARPENARSGPGTAPWPVAALFGADARSSMDAGVAVVPNSAPMTAAAPQIPRAEIGTDATTGNAGSVDHGSKGVRVADAHDAPTTGIAEAPRDAATRSVAATNTGPTRAVAPQERVLALTPVSASDASGARGTLATVRRAKPTRAADDVPVDSLAPKAANRTHPKRVARLPSPPVASSTGHNEQSSHSETKIKATERQNVEIQPLDF